MNVVHMDKMIKHILNYLGHNVRILYTSRFGTGWKSL